MRIVADAGQHLRALGEEAADTFLHAVEGGGGFAHLRRPLGADGAGVAAQAEILGRGGQAADGAHLVAHEQGRDAEQQD